MEGKGRLLPFEEAVKAKLYSQWPLVVNFQNTILNETWQLKESSQNDLDLKI